MKQKYSYAVRPDAQAFDEIRIRIVPRYKQSGLSGDEWRISVAMDFYRKGQVVHTSSCGGRMEWACGLLFARFTEATDNGKGYFAGDGIHCDQEGCSEPAKFVMKIKKRYCVGGGNCGQETKTYSEEVRCFCEKHKTRGDCDLEDNDNNYELVEVL